MRCDCDCDYVLCKYKIRNSNTADNFFISYVFLCFPSRKNKTFHRFKHNERLKVCVSTKESLLKNFLPCEVYGAHELFVKLHNILEVNWKIWRKVSQFVVSFSWGDETLLSLWNFISCDLAGTSKPCKGNSDLSEKKKISITQWISTLLFFSLFWKYQVKVFQTTIWWCVGGEKETQYILRK